MRNDCNSSSKALKDPLHSSSRGRALRAMTMTVLGFALGLALVLGVSSAVSAAEFRSVGANGTIMFDGPSMRANKLYVATAQYPVEIIQSDAGWARVRDFAGDLAWVELKSLSEKRTVLVLVPTIDARQKPDEMTPIAFQARQGVALEFVDASAPGWIRVRHRDGAVGFVRLREVWGYY
jgi:SH3-like domain-containing protein